MPYPAWLCCTLDIKVPLHIVLPCPSQASSHPGLEQGAPPHLCPTQPRARTKAGSREKGSVVQHICARGTAVQREAQKHLEPQHWIIFNANLSSRQAEKSLTILRFSPE